MIVGRYFGILFTLLLLAGCVNKRSEEEMKDSLVFGYMQTFASFDPTRQRYMKETSIMSQCLETLVRWNNDLLLEPHLAESWESLDNCTRWIFHLRKGVLFHDGTPFNADAVKAHFERTLDPKTASTRGDRIKHVSQINALDDHTVEFILEKEDCIFVQIVAASFTSIPSPTAVAALGDDIGRRPVGTGPYRLVKWIPEVTMQFERFPEYWRPEAIQLERLEFRPVRENTTRYILLEQGVLDMADIDFAQVKVARDQENIVLQTTPQLAVRYVGFNYKRAPFDDVRVRQAANFAIDRDAMIKYIFFDVGEPARGALPSALPDYNRDIEVYEYNPERARQLLAEAGYPNGVEATMWTMEAGEYRVFAEAIAEYLRQVGINVTLRMYDNAAYWDKFNEYTTRTGERYPNAPGVYDLFVGGWAGGEAADGFLDPLFRSDSLSNNCFYDNPEVDRLVALSKKTADDDERRRIYHEIQRIISDDAPWIFSFHSQVSIGLRPRVQGFQVNATGRYFFEDVFVLPSDANARGNTGE